MMDNAYHECMAGRIKYNVSSPCRLYAINDAIGYDEAMQEFHALERERREQLAELERMEQERIIEREIRRQEGGKFRPVMSLYKPKEYA